MNSSDEDEIDYWKQFKQKRENPWNRIFEKYELLEDDDDETTISVEDIANEYGKMSRNRSSVQNNVYEECHRSAIKGETEVAETSGLSCKRRRPPTKNNTGIKIEDEEVEASNIHECSNENIKRQRGRLHPKKNIKEENTNELNRKDVIVRNGTESTSNKTAPKRGRQTLKNSLKENLDCTNPRKRKRPSKNDTRIKIEDEEFEAINMHEFSNTKIKCQWDGLRKNIKEENTNELKHENLIVGNEIESTSDIIAQKRGRTALRNCRKEKPDPTNLRKSERLSKNSTRIKIENEVEVDNTHEIRNEKRKRKRATPCSSKNRRAENSLEEIIVIEDDEIESTFNVISRKRNKTALKNNVVVNPYNTNPTKYFLRPQIKQNSTKTGIIKERFDDYGSRKRGRPHLDKIILEEMNATNIKNKSSTKYKSYIVHSSCIKDLQQKYLDFKIIKEFSKSFTVVSNKKKRSPRSKSCSSYSSKRLKSLQPLYTTDKNEKQDKTLTKTYDSPPRKTSSRSKNKNYNNTLLKQKQPLYTEDEKKNPDQYANEKSLQTITAASSINEKVLQDVSDSDLLNTKFIIEEKLKSDLGLMMIKRSHNQQLARENKENNFSLWHNEVKNELIKLRKIISMEKLEQYIMWYLNSWQASNNGSKKN